MPPRWGRTTAGYSAGKSTSNNPMNYGVVHTNAGVGIDGGIGQGDQPLVTFLRSVDDPQKFLDRAAELGGRCCTGYGHPGDGENGAVQRPGGARDWHCSERDAGSLRAQLPATRALRAEDDWFASHQVLHKGAPRLAGASQGASGSTAGDGIQVWSYLTGPLWHHQRMAVKGLM